MTGRAAVLLLAALLLAGCSTPPDGPAVAAPAAPPPPPPSCLLDLTRFDAATGVPWVPAIATATATRCVYDPGGRAGDAFVAVELGEPVDADTLAELCDQGTRDDVAGGFVCRFRAETVYAAAVGAERTVTVSASTAPAGSSADRLAAGIAEQLPALL